RWHAADAVRLVSVYQRDLGAVLGPGLSAAGPGAGCLVLAGSGGRGAAAVSRCGPAAGRLAGAGGQPLRLSALGAAWPPRVVAADRAGAGPGQRGAGAAAAVAAAVPGAAAELA